MLEDLKGGTSEFEFFSNKTLTENESYDDQEDTKDNVANVDQNIGAVEGDQQINKGLNEQRFSVDGFAKQIDEVKKLSDLTEEETKEIKPVKIWIEEVTRQGILFIVFNQKLKLPDFIYNNNKTKSDNENNNNSTET